MPIESRQVRFFALLLIAVVGLLAALWFLLLRTEYTPIYENIRENDASHIVAELESSGISYRLENGGHDILVPADKAADARVAVAGAELPMGGTTGFELFNENELGLTEFAQKINLQRAMQGELARTIMMMDGVEFARVHLALPERSLFRSEQENPTAAVTVEMRPSHSLNAGSVAGIRQLVASSVPGLALENVVVLDDHGDLVSTSPLTDSDKGVRVQSEREAIEGLLTIRATDAIAQALPQQPFDVQISAFERISADLADSDEVSLLEGPPPAASETRAIGLENRALRVLVRTPQQLGPEERSIITDVLAEALQLSTIQGDVLDFSMGALTSASALPDVSDDARRVGAQPPLNEDAGVLDAGWTGIPSPAFLLSSWFLIPLALLAVFLLAIRPRARLSKAETEDFAELLRGTSLDSEGR